MKIREVIWLREFADKIEVKIMSARMKLTKLWRISHQSGGWDVGQEREKISIAQWARPLRAGTCRSFLFTKGKDEH